MPSDAVFSPSHQLKSAWLYAKPLCRIESCTFIEFLNSKLESRQQVYSAYFDFKKAFELVSHSLLVEKLAVYGHSSSLCDWFKSYLSHRWNYVTFGGTKSSAYCSTSGVPQGSNVSPLLFNIFEIDICLCVSNSEFSQIAHNIKLFRTISDYKNLLQDITAVTGWYKDNNPALNPTKTKLIYFSRNHSRIAFEYILDNCLIERVSVVRDLGVLMDSELKLSKHVEFLTNAC